MVSSSWSNARRRTIACVLGLSAIALALGVRTHAPFLALAVIAAASVVGVVACLRQRTRRSVPESVAVIADGPSVPMVHFADDEPRVFCSGWLRPRVFISTGALFELPSERLRVLVAHQRHHARRRDPLRLLAAHAVADGLPFLPGVRSIVIRLHGHLEAAAVRASAATPRPGDAAAVAGKAACSFAAGASSGRTSSARGATRVAVAAWGLVPLFAVAALAVHAGGLLPLSALDPAARGGRLCLVASAALLLVAAGTVRDGRSDSI